MLVRTLIITAGFLGAIGSPAMADVYTYVGNDHVTVLTNLKPQGRDAEVLVNEAQTPSFGSIAPKPVAPGKRHPEFDQLIAAAAEKFSVDSALLHAVISVESGYMVMARSHRGASGLMQLMPETARAFGTTDLFDPAQNINGGARYLKYLLDKYDYKLDLVLSAYNAGEKALARYGGKIPPFRETLRYIAAVRERYLRYRHDLEYETALSEQGTE
jgi:soluble lytic murein transglycosylase-like protein